MFDFIRMLFWRKELGSSSKWFDENQPAQDRFWELEDWTEELEDRIINLENALNNINNKINSK